LRRVRIKTAEMKQATELRSRSATVIGQLVFEAVVYSAFLTAGDVGNSTEAPKASGNRAA
jgi:hypothetical protein